MPMMLPPEFFQEHVIQEGYEFRYSRSGDGYRITAMPGEYRKTGKRSFFSDETVVVRFTQKTAGRTKTIRIWTATIEYLAVI